MPKTNRYSAYDDFAWVYNKHWGNMFTPTELAVFTKLVAPGIPDNARILDLCCGTGQLAQELTERGYSVSGLDGSEAMLGFARENAPGVKFILDDARAFEVPDRYDLVISMFDSLNHVMTIDELTDVFRRVRDCLKTGGLFLFDLNMESGYAKNWDGYYVIVEDDHVCVLANSYQPEEQVGRVDVNIFRLENGAWRRSDFTLTQKCYSEAEIRSALKKAGFASAESYFYSRNRGLKGVTARSKRAFFLCRK